MTGMLLLRDVVPWLATKKGHYWYGDNCNCALAQYCKEVLHVERPIVGGSSATLDGIVVNIQPSLADLVVWAAGSFERAFERGLILLARETSYHETKASIKAKGSSHRHIPIREVQESPISV